MNARAGDISKTNNQPTMDIIRAHAAATPQHRSTATPHTRTHARTHAPASRGVPEPAVVGAPRVERRQQRLELFVAGFAQRCGAGLVVVAAAAAAAAA